MDANDVDALEDRPWFEDPTHVYWAALRATREGYWAVADGQESKALTPEGRALARTVGTALREVLLGAPSALFEHPDIVNHPWWHAWRSVGSKGQRGALHLAAGEAGDPTWIDRLWTAGVELENGRLPLSVIRRAVSRPPTPGNLALFQRLLDLHGPLDLDAARALGLMTLNVGRYDLLTLLVDHQGGHPGVLRPAFELNVARHDALWQRGPDGVPVRSSLVTIQAAMAEAWWPPSAEDQRAAWRGMVERAFRTSKKKTRPVLAAFEPLDATLVATDTLTQDDRDHFCVALIRQGAHTTVWQRAQDLGWRYSDTAIETAQQQTYGAEAVADLQRLRQWQRLMDVSRAEQPDDLGASRTTMTGASRPRM